MLTLEEGVAGGGGSRPRTTDSFDPDGLEEEVANAEVTDGDATSNPTLPVAAGGGLAAVRRQQ